MPKTFYTERDIEDLARQGVRSIHVDDDVVLTEIAREKAERLGIELVREQAAGTPAAAAPKAAPVQGKSYSPVQDSSALRQRVREAVIARLGGEVDPVLLDTIITRVLDNVGVK